jgi:Nif-specific regulatory protein
MDERTNLLSPSNFQEAIFELGKQLLATTDVKLLLTQAIDALIEWTGAERGLVILFDESDEELFEIARHKSKKDIERPQNQTSHTLIAQVRKQGTPFFSPNALEDPSLSHSESVMSLNILSVACLPLLKDQNIFGVVYLDHRGFTGAFTEETFAIAQKVTDFISLAAHSALERYQLRRQVRELEGKLGTNEIVIIGQHEKMLRLIQNVNQIAATDVSVLIQGESGTGKELIARLIHHRSKRRARPFIPVNCAALVDTLLESELFGHRKGAFTGAMADRVGLFERADNGTVFLDEVSDMSPGLQSKLLRVLQSGEYTRVGENKIRHADVRILAASSTKLSLLVKKNQFREDLYYRLNVVELDVPPLRERKSDIPLLATFFLNKYAEKYQKPDMHFSSGALEKLQEISFSGNVRQLDNIVQRVVVMCDQECIQPDHIPLEMSLL